jgi:hypothetical protein
LYGEKDGKRVSQLVLDWIILFRLDNALVAGRLMQSLDASVDFVFKEGYPEPYRALKHIDSLPRAFRVFLREKHGRAHQSLNFWSKFLCLVGPFTNAMLPSGNVISRLSK